MPDYSKGKIYCIRSFKTDDVYIGSTIQTLAERLGKHRRQYKCYLNGNKLYVSSFELLNYDDHYIELIKLYPCSCKAELVAEEGQYIRDWDCVNKVIPSRTKKQYYIDNRDKIKEKLKQYRINNKDKIREKRKQYYIDNRDKIKEYDKQYRIDNRDKIKENNKQSYIDNRNKIREKQKQYYIDNKDKIIEKTKQYSINNRDKKKEYDKQYRIDNRDKIKENNKQKITCICSSNIRRWEHKRHIKTKKHKKLMSKFIQNFISQ